jgi:hypothetical protein
MFTNHSFNRHELLPAWEEEDSLQSMWWVEGQFYNLNFMLYALRLAVLFLHSIQVPLTHSICVHVIIHLHEFLWKKYSLTMSIEGWVYLFQLPILLLGRLVWDSNSGINGGEVCGVFSFSILWWRWSGHWQSAIRWFGQIQLQIEYKSKTFKHPSIIFYYLLELHI